MGEHEGAKQVRSPEGLALLARVREVCARLPQAAEAIDGFGHVAFRVRDKSFAILGEGVEGASLSIKADLATQDALVRRGPFYRTPYIGQHGWVSVDAGAPAEWDEIEELLIDGWRRVAPKRLVRGLDA